MSIASENYLKPYYEKYWRSVKKESIKDLGLRTEAVQVYFPKNIEGLVLDFGCGRGEILHQLVNQNPKAKFVGIDISEEALAKASENVPKASLFKIVEGTKIPLPDASVDFITVMDVMEHVYDTEWMFNEISRVLKINGKVLISTPYCGLIKNIVVALFGFETVYEVVGPHIRFYTRKSLEECLHSIGCSTIKFDVFGRFYPLSKGMFVFAKKNENKFMRVDQYVK